MKFYKEINVNYQNVTLPNLKLYHTKDMDLFKNWNSMNTYNQLAILQFVKI